jgi:two-component system LytT family response regulator
MKTRIKTMIIDDEPDAVNFIHSIIREYCPSLEVIGTANNAMEGISSIREKSPDLVLLDVEMPHGSGFDLLAQFPEKTFDVIFITAFNHYAIRAIKFSAVDYILKPININEFIQAIEKVADKRTHSQEPNRNIETLLENLASPMPARLAIPTSEGMEYINTREIIRIEAERSYCWFYLIGKRKMLVSRNLKEYQDLLNDRSFFRSHNSHLVNLEFVKKYIKADGGSIVMEDGSQVPISRTRKDLFLTHMERFSSK